MPDEWEKLGSMTHPASTDRVSGPTKTETAEETKGNAGRDNLASLAAALFYVWKVPVKTRS